MTYLEFYNHLNNFNLVSNIWGHLIKLISEEIDDNIKEKDHFLKLITIYFSLIDDGNIAMSMDPYALHKKWAKKLDSFKVLHQDMGDYDDEIFDDLTKETIDLINHNLTSLTSKEFNHLFGPDKIFMISNNWLYLRKYFNARLSIMSSLDRIFNWTLEAPKDMLGFDIFVPTFNLKEGQKRVAVEGLTKNVIVTGGPGTGKTTSILFLILSLLKQDMDYNVYLTAPSGKAASRMKDSIIGGFNSLTDEFKKENIAILNKIKTFNGVTIHSLLGLNVSTNEFIYNERHQFNEKSIFIIDEASMIDINLFNALLKSIPSPARVFIMGDKNQLPSVDSGAVFGELLKKPSLKNNIVELDESVRFDNTTIIYHLANAFNNGLPLPINKSDWADYKDFHIEAIRKEKPVFYYELSADAKLQKEAIMNTTKIWSQTFYQNLYDSFNNVDISNANFKQLFSQTEEARILCAENNSIRGVNEINSLIKNLLKRKINGQIASLHSPGELIIITKNNKALDLENGNCGVCIKFIGDDNIYVMFNKTTRLVEHDMYKEDAIFKMQEYVFYPLRLISEEEMDMAYAISIHKSQGSDYKNILVVLPTKLGHPLLNRQLIYTAITRTKGNTYILSSQKILEEAERNILSRDTNID